MTHKKYVALGTAEEERRRKATLAARPLLNKYIKEMGKQKRCPICGEGMPETFQKHHMDGNHHNNAGKNIVKICANCHNLTYTAKGHLRELWEKRHRKWLNITNAAKKAWKTRRSA